MEGREWSSTTTTALFSLLAAPAGTDVGLFWITGPIGQKSQDKGSTVI
jgi:hypothetical protein